MICDKRMSAKTKGTIYKIVRPAVLYELETVAMTKNTRDRVRGCSFVGSNKDGQDKK